MASHRTSPLLRPSYSQPTRALPLLLVALAAVACTQDENTPADTDGSSTTMASDPSDSSSSDSTRPTSSTTGRGSTSSEPGSTTTPVDSSTSVDETATADTGSSGGESTSSTGDTTGRDFGEAMSFFVSSVPVFDVTGSDVTGDVPGDGNLIFTVPDSEPPVVLRGVEAADAFCTSLAQAAGSPRPNWVAYLSTHGLPDVVNGGNGPQIDARDRIGDGPWFNALEEPLANVGGVVLDNDTLNVPLGVILGEGRDADDPDNAAAVAAYLAARVDEALVLDETGVAISLSAHDVFTGSDADGRVYDGGYPERWFIFQRTPPPGDRTEWGTCNDWDYERFGAAPGTEFAQTGHTDVPSGGFSPSWNSAHDSVDCTVSGVAARGGAGHVFCFSPD